MKWFWKLKAVIYDPTIRRAGPLHRIVRLFTWRLSGAVLTMGSKLTKFELPDEPQVAPYFRLSLIFGTYECEVIAWYRRFLRPGMRVVDIGANVGYHTVRFAKLVGKDGRVFAFEPAPSNFEILKRNVRRRGLANVVLERKAVSEVTGTVPFYLGRNELAHSLGRVGDQTVLVESVRLDDYFRKDEKLDLVKIDVEGAEPSVLRGMQSLLAGGRVKAMILEFHPALLRLAGSAETPVELLRNLDAWGFDVYQIGPKGKLVRIEACGPGAEVFVSSVAKLTNLCAIAKTCGE